MSNHAQCTLRKGSTEQVSWIPEDKAVVGKFVKLRERGDEWDDGWEVISVGKVLPTPYVMERGKDHKNTRKASDI